MPPRRRSRRCRECRAAFGSLRERHAYLAEVGDEEQSIELRPLEEAVAALVRPTGRRMPGLFVEAHGPKRVVGEARHLAGRVPAVATSRTGVLEVDRFFLERQRPRRRQRRVTRTGEIRGTGGGRVRSHRRTPLESSFSSISHGRQAPQRNGEQWLLRTCRSDDDREASASRSEQEGSCVRVRRWVCAVSRGRVQSCCSSLFALVTEARARIASCAPAQIPELARLIGVRYHHWLWIRPVAPRTA